MKLGEILIKEKKISKDDLNAALELQKHNKDKLGKILIDMGLIDYMDLVKCLSLNSIKPALGELLIAIGLINDNQLKQALGIQEKKPQKKIGNILVELEYLNKNILAQFLSVQTSAFLSTANNPEIANGHGSISGENQSKYVGELQDGIMHGKGIFTDTDCRYVGDFYKGNFHGEGTMTSIDGHVLHSGEWKDGKPI
ncbi:MAG: hypothetical protein OEZ13_05195 [Spirochaetia bacterium]|nr:hypothetical protein [Spirochaetia bacterium]